MKKKDIFIKIARGIFYAGVFSVLGEGCREKTTAASKDGWKGTKQIYNTLHNLVKKTSK